MNQTGKYIFLVGSIIMAMGAVVWLVGNKISWFGNLPGDVRVEKENFKFYFPFTSMILLSVALSFLIWVCKKIFS
ncbi:MAG: DUF2905 domain-containing protein [Bacteroidia bacterium]